MRLSYDLPSRLGRLVLTALVALALSGGNLLAQGRDAAATQRVKDLRARLDRDIQTVADADRRIPRDTFDFQTVVRSAGNDPARLFAWVRDQTHWAPYRGALRGPLGVLMDRTGNSLDRSLLLAELLSESGGQVRLAHGAMPAGRASKALAALLARDARPGAAPAAGAAPAGSDLAQVRQRITDRAAAQAKAISDAIGAGVARQDDKSQAALKSAALQALADHWWVQAREKTRWVDYDALLPDARPGEALATADRTIEYKKGAAGNLPLEDALCHRIVIRVVAEQWKAGRLTEATVLDQSLRPAELMGRRIALSHVPLDWPAGADRMDSPQAVQKVRAAILAQHEWAPQLTIGAHVVIQSSVTREGEVNPKPLLGPTARMGGATAGAISKVNDIFGGLGGPPPAPKPKGRFTAEWVEYTIHGAQQPDRVIRREVFDLLGPAARARGVTREPKFSEDQEVDAGLAMLSETDILPLPCQLSMQYAGHVVLSDIVASRNGLADLLRRMESPSAATSASYNPQPAALYAMAALRCQWSRRRDDLYLDGLNLLTYHVGLGLVAGNQTRVRMAFDIVANQLAVRPRAWVDAKAIRLAQGVLDTNLETQFVEAGGQRDNAAEAFAASSPDKWVVLRSVDDPRWAKVQLPDDVRARIRAELQNGRIALAPQKPIAAAGGESSAWWVIDPVTGTTLGIGPRGYGVSMIDYAQQVAAFVVRNRAWICAGRSVFKAASMIAVVLGLPETAEITGGINQVLYIYCIQAPA